MTENMMDLLQNAIDDYNNSLVKNKVLVTASNEEKTGMFFTCLRRYFQIGVNGRNPYNNLEPKDLNCTFHRNGSIHTVKINKQYRTRYSFNEDEPVSAGHRLKNYFDQHPVAYPSRELNAMSVIVNSIK